jgi:hypothetical protein
LDVGLVPSPAPEPAPRPTTPPEAYDELVALLEEFFAKFLD